MKADCVGTILFPSSYINARRVDEAFEREYEAARKAGLEAALFHQCLWDEKRKIRLDCEVPGRALYRGWMMKPEEYAQSFLYGGLCGEGGRTVGNHRGRGRGRVRAVGGAGLRGVFPGGSRYHAGGQAVKKRSETENIGQGRSLVKDDKQGTQGRADGVHCR